MSKHDRLREIVEPIVVGLDLELFDLQYSGAVLSVLVDRPYEPDAGLRADEPSGARSGVDMAAITAVTRAVSRALDELDPIPGRYSLEVSSPGLERPLRTPQHFSRAVGEVVTIKTVSGYVGARRIKGRLVAAGPDGIDLALAAPTAAGDESVSLAYDDIDKARTVFEWGGEEKAAKPPKPVKKPRPAAGPDDPPMRAGQAPRPIPRGDDARPAKALEPAGPAAPKTMPKTDPNGPKGEKDSPQDAKTKADDKKVTAT